VGAWRVGTELAQIQEAGVAPGVAEAGVVGGAPEAAEEVRQPVGAGAGAAPPAAAAPGGAPAARPPAAAAPAAEAAAAQPAATTSSGNEAISGAVNKVTKWIPGEAIALYVAAITAFSSTAGGNSSWALLVLFVILSAALVILGAFAATGKVATATLVGAGLAAAGATIWSLTVPLSGWQRIGWVHDNQAAVAVGAAVVALLFTLVAEGVTKNLPKS
jgi:hypothetical protein